MTAAILAVLFLAQQNSATISGRVLDSSGAAVPGAMVVARNIETGLERPAIRDETGAYTIPLLPIGPYDVSGELAGFKKAVKTGIVLQVAQQARLDFGLGSRPTERNDRSDRGRPANTNRDQLDQRRHR